MSRGKRITAEMVNSIAAAITGTDKSYAVIGDFFGVSLNTVEAVNRVCVLLKDGQEVKQSNTFGKNIIDACMKYIADHPDARFRKYSPHKVKEEQPEQLAEPVQLALPLTDRQDEQIKLLLENQIKMLKAIEGICIKLNIIGDKVDADFKWMKAKSMIESRQQQQQQQQVINDELQLREDGKWHGVCRRCGKHFSVTDKYRFCKYCQDCANEYKKAKEATK